MIQGIDVVFLHSPDKDLAQWYAEVLGLKVHLSDGPWTEFKTGRVARFAVEHTDSPYEVENQSIMISFRVDDISQAVESLAGRGVNFYPSKETTIFRAGNSMVATFQDPVGNWVQLSQPVERFGDN
jgi:predicted enzyme related to lactoylglutathione lyase